MLQPDGPLRGLAIVAEARPDGSFTEPQLAFTTDDTEATAIVGLGDDVPADATLTVNWYRLVGIDGREHLFRHEIPVGPGGHAFSQGVAEGGLAPGLYETVATLSKNQVRTPWVVGVAAEGAGARAAMAGAVLLSTAGQESTLEDWEIPTPGESGWEDGVGPPPQGSPPTECTAVSINPGLTPMTDVNAYVWWLGPCPSQTLTATVSGPPVTLTTAENAPGPLSSLYGQTDVCDLPGGSDFPGTMVRFEAGGSATASESYTLPDLSETLTVGIESEPAAESEVEAGDTIGLHAIALVMPTAQGIEVLYVDDGSELIESVGNASGSEEPIPCDLGRHFARLVSEYRVPDNPPPVVEICANTTGFDGTEARECIDFYTGEVWEGSTEWTGSLIGSITYDVRLVVGSDGATSGTLTFVSCSTECGTPPGELGVAFRKEGDSFSAVSLADIPMRGTIPITDSRASGETTQAIPPRTHRWAWTLECKTCEG